VASATAQAQEETDSTEETNILRKVLRVQSQGFGGSSIASLGSFYFNGDYSLFSAGVGLGLSYKASTAIEWPIKTKSYPIEIGLYMAPQISDTKDQSVATVSALLHFTLVQSFGIGLGYSFWEKGVGLAAPQESRIFFTLGLGLTNENR
jgi:hypothetical protein